MHHLGINNTPPPLVAYGPQRLWDAWAYDRSVGRYDGACSWRHAHVAEGRFNWTILDSVLRTLRARGKSGDLIYTLDPSQRPDWVGPPGSAHFFTHLRDFVSAIVARAGHDIRIWGIANEPQGKIDDAVLAHIAQLVYPVVKAASPYHLVLTPEYQGNGSGNLAAFLMHGGRGYFDVIAAHLYGPLDPSLPTRQGGLPAIIAAYREVMVRHGIAHYPFWNTEGSDHGLNNFGGSKEENERDWIGQALPLLWCLGVSRVYYYAWDSEARITGRLVSERTGSAAGAARNLAGVAWDVVRGVMLGNAIGPVTITGARHVIDVTGRHDYEGRILWSYKSSAFYEPQPGRYSRIITLDGRVRALSGGVNSIPLGNTPVIIDNG
jgi:hypothetical protein